MHWWCWIFHTWWYSSIQYLLTGCFDDAMHEKYDSGYVSKGLWSCTTKCLPISVHTRLCFWKYVKNLVRLDFLWKPMLCQDQQVYTLDMHWSILCTKHFHFSLSDKYSIFFLKKKKKKKIILRLLWDSGLHIHSFMTIHNDHKFSTLTILILDKLILARGKILN